MAHLQQTWLLLLLLACAATALRPAGRPPVRRHVPASSRPPARRRSPALLRRGQPILQADGLPGGLSGVAVSFLQWYKRTISPLLPPGCRYVPTCSEYAIQSFKQYSVPQAAVLTAWRLVRCNPLHVKGYGFGLDEPCWPPPAYWAGSGRVRTPLDDEASRRKALGLDDEDRLDPFNFLDERRAPLSSSSSEDKVSGADSSGSE